MSPWPHTSTTYADIPKLSIIVKMFFSVSLQNYTSHTVTYVRMYIIFFGTRKSMLAYNSCPYQNSWPLHDQGWIDCHLVTNAACKMMCYQATTQRLTATHTHSAIYTLNWSNESVYETMAKWSDTIILKAWVILKCIIYRVYTCGHSKYICLPSWLKYVPCRWVAHFH